MFHYFLIFIGLFVLTTNAEAGADRVTNDLCLKALLNNPVINQDGYELVGSNGMLKREKGAMPRVTIYTPRGSVVVTGNSCEMKGKVKTSDMKAMLINNTRKNFDNYRSGLQKNNSIDELVEIQHELFWRGEIFQVLNTCVQTSNEIKIKNALKSAFDKLLPLLREDGRSTIEEGIRASDHKKSTQPKTQLKAQPKPKARPKAKVQPKPKKEDHSGHDDSGHGHSH